MSPIILPKSISLSINPYHFSGQGLTANFGSLKICQMSSDVQRIVHLRHRFERRRAVSFHPNNFEPATGFPVTGVLNVKAMKIANLTDGFMHAITIAPANSTINTPDNCDQSVPKCGDAKPTFLFYYTWACLSTTAV